LSRAASSSSVAGDSFGHLRKKKLRETYDDDLASYMSHFKAYQTWLDEDAHAGAVLVASMDERWATYVARLNHALKCGPFFASTMSPLVSPPILSPYVKSSCHNKVIV
jgi:hypothetical protein